MNCNLCENDSFPVFKTTVLKKYSVQYFQCPVCSFIQTEKPYWINEAYEDAISDMDTGIFMRNSKLARILPWVIGLYFNSKGRILDYGGGYGILVRMMRDRNFDFYWSDSYASNLFAKGYSIMDVSDLKFELVCSFEVFEHMQDPLQDILKMLGYSDSILFTTNLVPETLSIEDLQNWWYLSQETGQHISLYSKKSLEVIASKFDLNLYSNNYNFHLLTKKKIFPVIFDVIKWLRILRTLFIGGSLGNSSKDRDSYKTSVELR